MRLRELCRCSVPTRLNLLPAAANSNGLSEPLGRSCNLLSTRLNNANRNSDCIVVHNTHSTSVSLAENYRPDIDGLRAVAVLSVVFYHYGATWLPGGFTGVDVFFVISGYIITFHSLSRIELGNFTIGDFYRRRIRRITPPLILMVSFCIVFGWLYVTPLEYSDLAKSSAAAVIGIGNIYFYRNTGYFDPAAETQPLLHTWSLGVEEQFYFIWPLLLWLGLPLLGGRSTFRKALLAAVVCAFIYAVWETNNSPKAAFYLPHPRAWELGLGALIAFMNRAGSRLVSEAMSAIGLCLVGFSIFSLSSTEPFPGVNAAYACVGTALLVWPKQHPTACCRLLSASPLILIGQISYGIYLWHWPLIVFYRYSTLDQSPDGLAVFALLLMCLTISYLSYRYIERPIIRSRGAAARYLIASSVMVVLACLMIYRWEGVPARLSAEVLSYAAGASDYSQRRPFCHRTDEFNPPLDQSCRYGDQMGTPASAMWGDSHGVELAEAIGEILAAQGGSVIGLTYSSCPPALDFKAPLQNGCESFTAKALEFLANSSTINTVYIASYYEFYLATPTGPDFLAGLTKAVSALAATNKDIVIIASNPEIPGVSIPQAAARLAMLGQVDRLTVTLEEHMAYSATARHHIERLADKYDNVRIFDPASVLCRDGQCAFVVDSNPLLFDDNHISRTGAKIIADAICGENPSKSSSEIQCGRQ